MTRRLACGRFRTRRCRRSCACRSAPAKRVACTVRLFRPMAARSWWAAAWQGRQAARACISSMRPVAGRCARSPLPRVMSNGWSGSSHPKPLRPARPAPRCSHWSRAMAARCSPSASRPPATAWPRTPTAPCSPRLSTAESAVTPRATGPPGRRPGASPPRSAIRSPWRYRQTDGTWRSVIFPASTPAVSPSMCSNWRLPALPGASPSTIWPWAT